MSIFKGSGVAIVTPFDKDNHINLNVYKKLVEFQINNGTDAIIVAGTTGEGSTLSVKEKLQLLECALEVSKNRVPVIGCVGANSTELAVNLAKDYKKAGADGCLAISPYYNKATQQGIIEHFDAIANAIKNIPIILYNVPSRTGLNIDVSTVYKLSKIKNIVGIKEASGNISQCCEIAKFCNDDFYLYSGNDDQIIPILSLGGKGVISVLANVLPKETHDLTYNYLNGFAERGLEGQLKYLNLIKNLFIEVNPIPVKTCLNLMGFDVGHFRLPLTKMSDKNFEILKRELEGLKII